MKELKKYIAGIVAEFVEDPYIDASEEAIDCIELPDGRRAQVTIRVETNENNWMTIRHGVIE